MRLSRLLLLVVVLAVSCRIVLAQNPSDSSESELRAAQDVIACELADNDTLSEQFKSTIRERHGVDPDFDRSTYTVPLGEGIPSTIRCREAKACRGAVGVDITWCINLYYPSQSIELCLNQSSGETNATNYAMHLGLSKLFSVPTTLPRGSNLHVNNPLFFLSFSVLTCTAQGPNCNSKTFHVLDVAKAEEAAHPPDVAIPGTNELMLGRRNVIPCIADFTFQDSNDRPASASCVWYVNGTLYPMRHPNCDDPLRNNEMDCFEGNERVRFYAADYQISACPLRHFRLYSWMVIDNATEMDTKLMYKCRARYIATNPIDHPLSMSVEYSLVPVYPLVNIIPIETPMLPAGHTSSSSTPMYVLKPGEALHWRCTVLAGVGDKLVWMLNGTKLPSVDANNQGNISCAVDSPTNAFVVADEAKVVGEYERQLSSTLFLCRITELTAGRYECAVNRNRGGNNITEVWSANVLPSHTSSTNGSVTIIFGVTVGLAVPLILLILVAALIICCLHKKRQKQKQKREVDWTQDIFVTDEIPHITSGSSLKKAKNGSMLLQPVDPFEFPRSKLVFLNTLLGEGTFGVVMQAKAEDIVKSAPHRNIVAVKTPRDKAPPHEINNFWEELNLMKSMAPHNNIVNLLGHCTSPGGPIYMIIEYAKYGSLKDFLRECEEVVLQLNHAPQVMRYRSQDHHTYSPSSSTCSAYPLLVDKSQLCSQNGGGVFSPDITATPSTAAGGGVFEFPPTGKPSHLTRERLTTQDSGFCGETTDYQAAFNDLLDGTVPMAHSVTPLTHDYINSKGLLYMEDVQNFALQIACGLKHLEDIQIVHCDLAARNILIAEGFVLKIGDFGMARDVSEKEYYRKQGGQIPVKWTAPEALKDQIFTYKSDVWSFGVVLWEILTCGQQPFPKFKIRHSWEPFINYLMEGNRLSRPNGCPDNFYDIMQSCWHNAPDRRPTAEELIQVLSQKNVTTTSEPMVNTTVATSDSAVSSGAMQHTQV